MRLVLILLFCSLTFGKVSQASEAILVCTFNIFGAPFATSKVVFTGDDDISPNATLDHYGAVQQATVTVKNPEQGQWLSLGFDEGQADRELFQTVSARPAIGGEPTAAVLINPASPVMRNLNGTCVWQ